MSDTDRTDGGRHLGLGRRGHVGHGRLRHVAHRDRRSPRRGRRPLEAGVTLFDTAEVYGDGESERIIGRLLADDPSRRDELVLATKFMPSPQKLNVSTALRASLRGLARAAGRRPRRPVPDPRPDQPARPQARWPRRSPRCTQAGLVRAVGVSNYSIREMERDPRRAGASGACRWPRTRSSSRCCAAGPRPSGLLAACREPRRGAARLLARSARAGSPASTRPPTRRPASGRSPPTRWSRSTPSWPSCGAIGEAPRRHARRARSRCGGSSRRARCRSPAPRTPTRPSRTPARSAGRSAPTRCAALDAVALERQAQPPEPLLAARLIRPC